MKKILISLAFLSICSLSLAQTETQDSVPPSKWKLYWKFSGTVGLKFSQTQLVNWAAGGNSNFTGIAYANLKLNYKKDKIAWDTNLDTDLGAIYSTDFNSYKFRKANDKIKFTTTLGYAISPDKHVNSKWFLAANGSFKSQYMHGYEYNSADSTRNKLSGWASPSYTELSIGINWKWQNWLSMYVSPVAGLITSCTDSTLRHSYGVPPNKSAVASMGLTLGATICYEAVKNLKILTGVKLYTPYNDKDLKDGNHQKFGNFNVDWDFLITYQFLKVLNVSLTTNLKYYHKVLFNEPGKPTRRVQFQEILGLGVAYSF
jgi:hypothetical protein